MLFALLGGRPLHAAALGKRPISYLPNCRAGRFSGSARGRSFRPPYCTAGRSLPTPGSRRCVAGRTLPAPRRIWTASFGPILSSWTTEVRATRSNVKAQAPLSSILYAPAGGTRDFSRDSDGRLDEG